jgi:hypothetical protein
MSKTVKMGDDSHTPDTNKDVPEKGKEVTFMEGLTYDVIEGLKDGNRYLEAQLDKNPPQTDQEKDIAALLRNKFKEAIIGIENNMNALLIPATYAVESVHSRNMPENTLMIISSIHDQPNRDEQAAPNAKRKE